MIPFTFSYLKTVDKTIETRNNLLFETKWMATFKLKPMNEIIQTKTYLLFETNQWQSKINLQIETNDQTSFLFEPYIVSLSVTWNRSVVFLCTLVYFTNKTITKSKYSSMMIEGIVTEWRDLCTIYYRVITIPVKMRHCCTE